MYICIHSENNLSYVPTITEKKSCPNCLLVTIVTGRELFSLIVHRMCIFLMNIPMRSNM